MPLPLNQKTNRLSIAFSATLPAAFDPAAYAVPCELNMLTSGGSPTWMAACSVSPSGTLCANSGSLSDYLRHELASFAGKFPRPYQ